MKEKVLAIINEIRATKELSAVSSLNVKFIGLVSSNIYKF